jgi:hypothetical protein
MQFDHVVMMRGQAGINDSRMPSSTGAQKIRAKRDSKTTRELLHAGEGQLGTHRTVNDGHDSFSRQIEKSSTMKQRQMRWKVKIASEGEREISGGLAFAWLETSGKLFQNQDVGKCTGGTTSMNNSAHKSIACSRG